MGGDFGPPVTVPAAVSALSQYPHLNLILVGDEAVLKKALATFQYNAERLKIKHASQRVEMNESPGQALRTKKDSSMRVAINLVKEGIANACVSAGNTGALMVTARYVLKTIPGIDRPAIISSFPTMLVNKSIRMLDLGANVDSSAESLLQFAIMGSVLASALEGIEHPKVCLLNIGAEEIKGNEQVKQAAQLLTQSSAINYAGFIEADKIYTGEADVIVCDGFVGNIALKTSEGVTLFIAKLIKQAFSSNFLTKLVGSLAKPILKLFLQRVDPARYNGATLIGLQGTVIKSHGGADIRSFANAIREAISSVDKNIPELIHLEIERRLKNQI